MSKIGLEYDIFLNMSKADAQATTILEAMSWGFPVACTNQSGYSRENSLFYMSTEDMQFNIELIERIQNLNDSELKEIAAKNRWIAETKYSWHTFLGSIDNILRGEL
jgi:glycosyltransferase involved in cell wall biosynthesis